MIPTHLFTAWYRLGRMSANFEPKSKSIGDLLGVYSRERIVVPRFQRGYEWGKKHVEAFWKDMMQFNKEKSSASGKYFLGPIVILKKEDLVIELLDGQQRLATATILLSVLRDFARDTPSNEGEELAKEIQKEFILKSDDNFSLTLGETDELFFRQFIQLESAQKPAVKIRTERNIATARALLYEKVKALVGPSGAPATLMTLRSIRQMLRSDLVMACIPVESEKEAFRIFETLNDRGLRLSVPDLLLNYLMRVAKPESDRKDIRSLWSEMVELMGKRDINRFLRHLWVSQYGDLKSTDLFTALKDHIESQKLSSSDFVLACHEECNQYVTLITFDQEALGKIAARHVRHIINGLDCQAALPLLLSAFQKLPPLDFQKCCEYVLVFIVRYSVIGEQESGVLETILFNLAKEVRDKMNGIPDASRNKAATDCLKHIKETLLSKSPKDKILETKLSGFIVSPDYAGYLISRLALSMQTNSKEIALDVANLEHIYPRRPHSDEWGGKKGQEELNPFLWHIGNLTMLGDKINSKNGNKEFPIKRKAYSGASELEINHKIALYDDWTIATIEDRGKKLIDPILNLWNFDNHSRV
jgi:hypothetical protein